MTTASKNNYNSSNNNKNNNKGDSLIIQAYNSPTSFRVLFYTRLQMLTQSPHFLSTKSKISVRVKVKVSVRTRVTVSEMHVAVYTFGLKNLLITDTQLQEQQQSNNTVPFTRCCDNTSNMFTIGCNPTHERKTFKTQRTHSKMGAAISSRQREDPQLPPRNTSRRRGSATEDTDCLLTPPISHPTQCQSMNKLTNQLELTN